MVSGDVEETGVVNFRSTLIFWSSYLSAFLCVCVFVMYMFEVSGEVCEGRCD